MYGASARRTRRRGKKLENATMRTYHSRSIEDRLVVSGIELQRQKSKRSRPNVIYISDSIN
jgi:hypothetical protein